MSKRKKRPTVEELLCDRSRDNAQIEAELKAVLSEEPPTNARHHLHAPAAREALVARLKQGCTACRAIAAAGDAVSQSQLLLEQVSGLKTVANIVPSEVEDKLARVLLHDASLQLLDTFDAVLTCIMDLCKQCSAWPQTSEVQALLDVLIWTGRDTLAVVQDMADYQLTVTLSTQPTQQYATQPGGPAAGGVRTVSGRDTVATVLLRSVLDLATMDNSLSKRFYLLRRTAVSAVVTLMSGSRKNQLLLLSRHSQAYHTLMSRVLPQCGDSATQVDIFEVMFRCARTAQEKAYHNYLDAHMRGKFAGLLALDSNGIDLQAQLRSFTVTYNTSLKNSSVLYVQAQQMQILSPLAKGLEAAVQEVIVGVGHLSVDVDVQHPDLTDEPYTEVCDIDLRNISRVVVKVYPDPDSVKGDKSREAPNSSSGGKGSVHVQLRAADVQCKKFPSSLGTEVGDRAQACANGCAPWFKLGILLEESQSKRLLAALTTQGVAVVDMSGDTADPSQADQKPAKVSMGVLPPSYVTRQPLVLTKSTPNTTTSKIKPLNLFKTPQTAAAAPGAAAAADADNDAGDDAAAELDQEEDGEPAGVPAGNAEAPPAAAAAAHGELRADTPAVAEASALAAAATAEAAAEAAEAAATRAAAAAGAAIAARAAGCDSQMLDALLQTAQQLPTAHTGPRPTPSGSLMAGPSPSPAARPPRPAAAAGDAAAPTGHTYGKRTAPAAAVAPAAGHRRQQKEQQQQEEVDHEDIMGAAGDDQEADGQEGAGTQQESTLRSNSQDELDASPAAAVKARRRQQAKAASPTAANKGKGASRAGGARQTSTGAARPGGKGAEQQNDAAGAGVGKPPSGRGKRTAGQKVERRSTRRSQPTKETQDPIQDPDLPSLPLAPPGATEQQASADLPAWFNTSSAAPPPAPAAAAAPSSKVTTPYSSRSALAAAAAAAAAEPTAAGGTPAGKAAPSPASGAHRKGGRLAKLGAGTPRGKGKAASDAAKPSEAVAAAAAAGAAQGPDSYVVPGEDAAAATAAAEGAVHDAFPEEAPAAGAKGRKSRQAGGKGPGSAAGGAAGRGRKAPTKATKAAEQAEQQQQQGEPSGFEFTGGDSDMEAEGGARSSGRKAKPSKGGAKGCGGAAAKAGTKRKPTGAEPAAAKQKQQRRGAATAAAGDVEVADGLADAAAPDDVLQLKLETQPELSEGAAAGVEDDTALAADADGDAAAATAGGALGGELLLPAPAVAAPGAGAKKQRPRKQSKQQQEAAGAGGQSGAATAAAGQQPRASRASKSKALQAMQQQQQLLATQAEEQGELEAAGGGEDDIGGDMFGGQTDEADGLAELGVVLESPGAPPGSEAAGSDDSSDSDDDDDRQMGDVTRMLTAAYARGLQAAAAAGRTTTAAAGRQGRAGEGPAAAAATPDTLKIDTAKVARKLALTAAANNAGANRRRPAAAAACKAAAVAAARDAGFQLAGLQLGHTARNDADDADAATGTGSGSEATDSDEAAPEGAAGDEAGAALPLPLTGFRPPALNLSLKAGSGLGRGLAAGIEGEDEVGAVAGAKGLQGLSRRQPDDAVGVEGDEAGGPDQEKAAVMAQLLMKAMVNDSDDDSDDDDEDAEMNNALATFLAGWLKRRQDLALKRKQRAIAELETAVTAQVEQFQAQIKEEYDTLNTRGQQEAQRLMRQLEARAENVQAVGARALKELAEEWEQYRSSFNQLSGVYQKLRDAQQHKTGSNKRKVAELQQEIEGRIAQKEQELLAKRPRSDGSWQKLQTMLGMLE